jgi:hypothetical protein
MNRTANKEKGVALILALLLILVASVIAVSLSSVSRTEGFASMNYRLMSQSRDAAEGGVHKAANFVMNSYTKPGGAGNPMSNYVTTGSPVTYNGHPVVLSANSHVSSNYPVSADQSSFNSSGSGNLTASGSTINYATSAKLLSMHQITPYGTTTPTTIQTWAITSDGSVSGMQNADVEVTSTLEQQASPVFTYAAFATATGCSALTFGGGGTTDSYDSSTASGGSVTTQAYGGNVGTNGNLSTNGNPTTINGNLSTPRTGVGSCSANNVTAWTSGSGHVTGSVVELPQSVSYPTPVIPAPGTVDISTNSGCPSGANAIAGCSSVSGGLKLDAAGNGGTISVRDISMQGNKDLHLTSGTYNINSISESGQTELWVDSGPVVINVTGTGNATPIQLTGGGVSNSTLNPMNLQILYAGTGAISLKGGAQGSGLLYAPNASYSFGGNGDWYGAVIGASLTDMGGAAIHYDRRLASTAMMVGPYSLGSFSWKKY